MAFVHHLTGHDPEVLRQEILNYFQMTRDYPDDLSDLARDLPCQRPLRGTLLRYHRTPDGFEMSFRDWLVTYVGSESAEMRGYK